MTLTSVSIRKPLMMVMVILAVVLFGVVSFTRLPIDLMPEMDLPFVTVQAVYAGAGPEQIETAVVEPIEEQMTTIAGLKNMTSYCLESVAFILLEFDLDVDADIAAIDVKDKIDAILYNLPSDLQKPVIGKFDPASEPIMELALYGPASPEKLRQMAERRIKDRLVKINGVGTVNVVGGREREIHVDLRREKMEAHGLSVFNVFPVIAAQSASFPAGYVTGMYKEQTVRVQGEFESVDDIATLQIPAMAGGRDPVFYNVRLSDIADVRDTYKEVREAARLSGRDAVGIGILKRPDANTVEVSKEIKEALAETNRTLPPGFEIAVAKDRSQFVKDAYGDSISSMIVGILLTALILLVFLFDWKLALIAAITMPASVIMAFVGMELLGFTLNIVTLMALSISVGILVANSIVVLENIVRYRNGGMPIREAADKGTSQIAVAVMASALTNLAVFVPVATTGGITGNVFRALGLTIVFATIASLFLSFTLTPLMSAHMLRSRASGENGRGNVIDRLMGGLERWYHGVLERILASGYRMAGIVAATLALLVLTTSMVMPRLGMEFFPESDQGYVQVAVELPPGTSFSRTDETLKRVERAVGEFGEVVSVASNVGGEGFGKSVNTGTVIVKLKPAAERTRSSEDMARAIRPLLADLPDATVVVSQQKMMGGGRAEGDIEVEVTGSDLDGILALADSVEARMRVVAGLVDISKSYKGVRPEIQIIPDRDRLEHYGLNLNIGAATTVQSLGGIMRFSMTGNDQAVLREGSEEYPIRVQIAPEDRRSIDDVVNMAVPTPSGYVPVKALAQIELAGGESSVTRKNRQRMVSVYANVAEGSSGQKVAELKKVFAGIPVPAGYGIGFGGMHLVFAGIVLARYRG